MKLTQKLIIGFVVVIVLASGFKTIDKAKNETLGQDKETKTSSETTEIASSSVDETTSETTEGTEATSNLVDEKTMPAS